MDDWEGGNLASGGTVNTITQTDGFVATDQLQPQMTLNRLRDDAFALTDSQPQSTFRNILLDDLFSLGDQLLASVYRNKLVDDAFVLIDEIIKSIISGGSGTINTVTLTDGFTLSDDLLAFIVRNRLLGDGFSVDDGPAVSFTETVLTADDGFDLTDSLVTQRYRNRVLDDFAQFVDSITAVTSQGGSVITRVLDDGFVFSDDNQLSALRGRVMLDLLLLTDGFTSERTLNRLLEDPFAVVDEIIVSTSTIRIIDRILSDGIDFSDGFLTALYRTVVLTDTMSIVDSLTAMYIPGGASQYDYGNFRIGVDMPVFALGGFQL